MKQKHLRALNRRANWLKRRIKEEEVESTYDKAELSALIAVLLYFDYDNHSVSGIMEEE